VNNQLKHQGYIGSIEASLEDNCLFGKILFIKALVSYEGKPSPNWMRHFVRRWTTISPPAWPLGKHRKNHARVHSTCGSGMTFIWPQPWKLHARR